MESNPVREKRLHPRVGVSGLTFPGLTAVEAVETLGGLGVSKTSITADKLRKSGAQAVADACRRHDVAVVATTGSLRIDLSAGTDVDEQLQRAREDIDQAAVVGATTVYSLTGRRSLPHWDANAEAYADAVAGLVEHAAGQGITLAVEPSNWLYADLTFVHNFHDAVRVASRAGMAVCFDIFHVWTEGNLQEAIQNNIGLISHVQLSDMEVGARSLPCRAVPGDGQVPLAAVVRWLLDAGYEGAFDCELAGPRIDAIGHLEAATRAAGWLDALLVELGA